MGAVPGFNDLPGLFVAELELLLQGVDVTGLTEQMLDVGASQASTTLTTTPQLEWLGLSVATPREVRLVQDLQGGPGPDDAAAPSRPSLFEAVFEDDHAEEWISALRDRRAAVLACRAEATGSVRIHLRLAGHVACRRYPASAARVSVRGRRHRIWNLRLEATARSPQLTLRLGRSRGTSVVFQHRRSPGSGVSTSVHKSSPCPRCRGGPRRSRRPRCG